MRTVLSGSSDYQLCASLTGKLRDPFADSLLSIWGWCTSLRGTNISTEKNAMAADAYAKFVEPVEPREVADGIA